MALSLKNSKIVVTHSEAALAQAWRKALALRLPEAEIIIDPRPNEPAAVDDAIDDAVEFGVGWQPPDDFFARYRRLRGFFSAAAGVEHVLGNPGLPLNLPVIRLEDAGMSIQMIEYCCQQVFRLRGRTEEYEQQQARKTWLELTPIPRSSMRIGVFGLGVLGTRVASALASFGYPIAGFSRTPKDIAGIACFSGISALSDFLARSDVLILLAPLTVETRRFLNASTLASLPKGAYLINVARGGLIDDAAVLEALDSGQLGGASLDVFNAEPLPAEHAYWKHPKVRITPHVSAITLVDESADQVMGKLKAWVGGASIGGIVDRACGY